MPQPKPSFPRILLAALLAPLFLAGCDTFLPPDFNTWPVDATGYDIEPLPAVISASYAQGDDVYFVLEDGPVVLAKDSDLSQPWQPLGTAFPGWARMIFVSREGTIFVSPEHQPVYRSTDRGKTWSITIDVPAWRADEDDEGSIYVGEYINDNAHVATLYKSTDGGETWNIVFQDDQNNHIHTVRWDDTLKRLYIAYGDGGTRGQAYSDDRGATFHVIASGPYEGDTDMAIARDRLIWGSDDGSGRVYRTDRSGGSLQTLMGWSQYMWFAVAKDNQVFIGTMSSKAEGGEFAAILASNDQGDTWQKILVTDVSTGPYSHGMVAESRNLSAGGWLYFTRGGTPASSYRVRRSP